MKLPSLLFLFILLLSGCSLFRDGNEPDGSNCVPYARHVSGVQIYGDAHQWWQKADGIYRKGRYPEPGAVLVLSKTGRLRYGHLAVVDKIKKPRLITVNHANWRPREISENMSVMDVSPRNDWSQLRFWNEEAGAFGKIYPALGFIYSTRAVAGINAESHPTFCLLSGYNGN